MEGIDIEGLEEGSPDRNTGFYEYWEYILGDREGLYTVSG